MLSIERVRVQIKVTSELELIAAFEDQRVRIPGELFVLVQLEVELGLRLGLQLDAEGREVVVVDVVAGQAVLENEVRYPQGAPVLVRDGVHLGPILQTFLAYNI